MFVSDIVGQLVGWLDLNSDLSYTSGLLLMVRDSVDDPKDMEPCYRNLKPPL